METQRKTESYFESALNDFCIGIVEEWSGKKVMESEEYQELSQKVDKLHGLIAGKLGDDSGLISRFEDAHFSMLHNYTAPAYLQGMRDCILLLRTLELL